MGLACCFLNLDLGAANSLLMESGVCSARYFWKSLSVVDLVQFMTVLY